MFTYTCGDLEWSTTGNRPAVVGYNAGGTYFENHRSSGFDTVANDVSCVVELTRSKRDNHDTTIGIEFGANATKNACLAHYFLDQMLIPQNAFRFALHCPKTLDQVVIDPLFEIDTQFRDRENCYIQRFAVSESTFQNVNITYGQQCCYNISG